MKPLSYETLLQHPETLEALHLQARRERARAFHHLVFRPLKAFFTPAPTPAAPATRTRMLHRSATC